MGDFAVRHRGNDGRRVSKDQQRFYLTSRDRRRLRSLAVTIVTVAVLGTIVVFAVKQLQKQADPSTPAEVAWADQAQPLLATVDRIVTRHDALAAASAATGRPAARPTAALLASIRSTLRSYRKLPAAPPRLRAFRVEPIAALTAASKAYTDYAAGARTGDTARLAHADLQWRQALALLGRLDQLVTGVTVPAAIKPSSAVANFVAFGASLASDGPHLRAAQAPRERVATRRLPTTPSRAAPRPHSPHSRCKPSRCRASTRRQAPSASCTKMPCTTACSRRTTSPPGSASKGSRPSPLRTAPTSSSCVISPRTAARSPPQPPRSTDASRPAG